MFVLSLLGRFDLQGAQCGRMLESDVRKLGMFCTVCLIFDDSDIIEHKKPFDLNVPSALCMGELWGS